MTKNGLFNQHTVQRSLKYQQSLVQEFDVGEQRIEIEIWFLFDGKWQFFHHSFDSFFLILDMKYETIRFLNESFFVENPMQVFDFRVKQCEDEFDSDDLENTFCVDEDNFLCKMDEHIFVLLQKEAEEKQNEIQSFDRHNEVVYSRFKQIVDPLDQKLIFEVYSKEIQMTQNFYILEKNEIV